MVGSASAVLVTVSYTADNIVDTYYLQPGTVKAVDNHAAGDNRTDWRVADTFSMDLEAGVNYSFIWRVTNDGPMSKTNPAGFLAEIDYGGSENYFSGIKWTYAIEQAGSTLTSDYNTNWVWKEVTAYGYNGGHNIWTTNNSYAAVTGISEQAQWIWSENNFQKGGDQQLYIRADFAPVPEPTTLLLFGSGLLGLAAIARRKRS